MVMESDNWASSVENVQVIGPNIVYCEMVTGRHKRWYIVGCYLPPSDKEGVTQRMVIDALKNRPKGTCPIVIGNLNSDLAFPRDIQEEILSSVMTVMTLTCASNGYRARKKQKKTKGKWSF